MNCSDWKYNIISLIWRLRLVTHSIEPIFVNFFEHMGSYFVNGITKVGLQMLNFFRFVDITYIIGHYYFIHMAAAAGLTVPHSIEPIFIHFFENMGFGNSITNVGLQMLNFFRFVNITYIIGHYNPSVRIMA